MAKYFTLQVPCKSYIRKYYNARYGCLLKADSTHPLGLFLQFSIGKETYAGRHSGDLRLAGVNDNLPVHLNKWQWEGMGHTIAHDKILPVNQLLEALFLHDLTGYVEAHTTTGRYTGLSKAIEQFAVRFGIDLELDVTSDALKKKIQRRQRKLAPAA